MTANPDVYDLYNPTESHQLLRDTVRSFVKAEVEPQALEFDRAERFNLSLFRKLGDLGLLGVTVPMAHGGSEMDAAAAVIVHEELSYADPGFALAYLAHSMLCVNNLAFNCDEAQQARFLPKLCSGEWVGAMGMSEPGAGTDVLGMQSQAIRDGDAYVLNGRKMWITNGCIDEEGTACDLVLVYAKTGDVNGRPQLTSFVVEKGMPGFSVGQKIQDKTGMRASNTAELVFEDVRIPIENMLGAEGDSMIHMMRNLELERLTLAAMSVGIARRCVEDMSRYASERTAFGKTIDQFGQIQRHVGESFAEYRAVKAYVYETARQMKLDKAGNRLDSDGVKLVASTMAKNVADRAMQVMGGYGYVGEYVVERLWRDAKLLEIGGGTLEAHQKNIARDLARNPDLFIRL
jgi:isovaleryl-CoA dehydrogenase